MSLAFQMSYYKITKKGNIAIRDNEFTDTVEFAYLTKRLKRTWFPPMDSGENDVLCASDDSVRPNRGKQMMPGPCHSCDLARWQGAKKPPLCTEIHELILLDTERKKPFIFPIKRASIKPFSEFMSDCLMQFDAQIEEFPLELCLIGKIEVVEEKKDKKEYFLPKFSVIKKASKEEVIYFSKVKALVERLQMEAQKERALTLSMTQSPQPKALPVPVSVKENRGDAWEPAPQMDDPPF